LEQQQNEQEMARKLNFDQLVLMAQQSLVQNNEEFECAICFTTVLPGEGVMLRECLHCFCRLVIQNIESDGYVFFFFYALP
jgi:RanBP-type and C3HC4-type zinc finger-containing protein 1